MATFAGLHGTGYGARIYHPEPACPSHRASIKKQSPESLWSSDWVFAEDAQRLSLSVFLDITSTNPHTMFFKKTKKPSASTGGSLYVSASEFINYVSKDQISGPVAARPMGAMDITACDVICRGVPTSEELHLLRRRVRQTASALGTRANRSIEQSILV
ncbi:hypothetical protein LPJ55_004117 [Coemansia sp. RSA 990]|nr:hypothetical protein BX667DRAFT_515608 [Coemansia mojavensis]KAJ1750711.1 hypothetical protein LPJ79_002682 [Coemansia sp. RSA 1821]KAJ1871137.1 hypothetical protein LPJ55_004117 [Coemansia sp. RSA 990]KAJ2677379.1 hypothetical protein IWW42_000186 [Coemansia sp. RSA 1085]